MAKERKSSPRRRKTAAKPRTRKRAKDGTNRGRVPMLLKDETLLARICAVVRMGATYKDACGSVGISQQTLYHWLELAKKENADAIYKEFLEKLERARTEGMSALVGMVHKAARGEPVYDKEGTLVGYVNGDWKAASHLLALRDPEAYSLRYKIEHSGPQGEPIGVQILLPPEDEE